MQPAEYKAVHQTRILVDRRAALGDVLMITPVLRELRRRYPEAWLQVVTQEPVALHNNPHVSKVVKPEEMTKEDPWDLYLNLNDAYELNVTSHYVDSYLHRAFGDIAGIDRSLELVPTAEEIAAVDDAIADIGTDYVVLHMRRWAWENKNLDVETWARFFTFLNDKYPNVKVISVGAKYDYRVTGVMNGIDLVDQLSVGEIAHLIANAKCFIGGDSGPYHIAATTKTPIVALLSHLYPNQILHWRDGEFGKDFTVVSSHVTCLGCYARQTPPVRNLVCENSIEWACSKNFKPEEIFQAVENYL